MDAVLAYLVRRHDRLCSEPTLEGITGAVAGACQKLAGMDSLDATYVLLCAYA